MSFSEYGTIAAIATAPMEAGIGVIRLSGPEALSVGQAVFSFKSLPKDIRPGRLYYGSVVDPLNSSIIDNGFLVYMKGPASYTGEDVVELQLHGSPAALRKALEAVLRSNVRIAGPGEFTKRAFLNGRLDLAQAEAVIDVIRARTDDALKSAQARLEGRFSEKVNRLKQGVFSLLSRIEAELDFPEEEDAGSMPMDALLADIEASTDGVKKLLLTFEEGRALRQGVRTLILGRPNAGKSSLLNILLEEERAIVTEFPGTTRDIIEEAVNIKGVPFILMDTAGLRESADFIESIGVRKAKEKIATADIILFVLDAANPSFDEDKKLIQFVEGKKILLIANKTDIVSAEIQEEVKRNFPGMRTLFISALNPPVSPLYKGGGIEALKEALYEEATGKSLRQKGDASESGLVASVRHKDSLQGAYACLLRAKAALSQGMEKEFIAADLREALNRLGEITGEVFTEDILDKIFSEFCIGK